MDPPETPKLGRAMKHGRIVAVSDLHDDARLAEQKAYYRARASEYDEWFFRRGRYDRGHEVNERWFIEADEVRQALDAFKPAGRVLELACGTGLWTMQLIRHADHVTAVDAAEEMIAVNAQRLQSPKVRYVQADIFDWRPEEQYDTVFFGFWLSHVPPERFDAFWEIVASALAPGGRVFFVDSRYDTTSTANDHHLDGIEATTSMRRLNDGREFRIVKVFYLQASLSERLAALGWNCDIRETRSFFIHGQGSRTGAQQTSTKQQCRETD